MISKNTDYVSTDFLKKRLRYRVKNFIKVVFNDKKKQLFLIAMLLVLLITNAILSTGNMGVTPYSLLSLRLYWYAFTIIEFCVIYILWSDSLADRKYYDAFLSIGFKNSVGIPPILIYQEVKDNIFVITFDSVGIPLETWINHKESIQNILNITIQSFDIGRQNNEIIMKGCKGSFDFKSKIYWSSEEDSTDDSNITIGKSIFSKVKVDLNYYPHILIGGSTGSGKTWLLKLILMQCINKDYEIIISDFKGGVDYPSIWQRNCSFATTLSDVTSQLKSICTRLESRKNLFSQFGYGNIDIYNQSERNPLTHIIFACDELAELLDTTGLSTKEKAPIKEIEKYISTIARLGRAFGIHLILATQRPDANILSGQIKNNISYKICGRADQILSQIILDSTDAYINIPSDSQGLFINQDGILFKSFIFDENIDIKNSHDQ